MHCKWLRCLSTVKFGGTTGKMWSDKARLLPVVRNLEIGPMSKMIKPETILLQASSILSSAQLQRVQECNHKILLGDFFLSKLQREMLSESHLEVNPPLCHLDILHQNFHWVRVSLLQPLAVMTEIQRTARIVLFSSVTVGADLSLLDMVPQKVAPLHACQRITSLMSN